MKKLFLLTVFTFSSLVATNDLKAQEQEVVYVKITNEKKKNEQMKTYLIEREIPNAGNLTSEELKGISQKSCTVLTEMGNGIEWLHSYVTDNKVYCLYKANNEELIKEHAKKGEFPVNRIEELATKIGPETAKLEQ